MNLLTESFSMYSDMSIRIMFFSEPNTASATALESSVFPTPVGPRNKNDPVGLLGSFRPTRPRRMALAIAATASSCATMRFLMVSSSVLKRDISETLSVVTGIFVQAATTS